MPKDRHQPICGPGKAGLPDARRKGSIGRRAAELVRRYWPFGAAFAVGVALTPAMVSVAYSQRGYHAVGGEVLLPLLFVLAVGLVRAAASFVKEAKRLMDEADD